MRIEELRRGLREIADAQPANGDASVVIRHGERRLRRRRVGTGLVVLAVVGASVGIAASVRGGSPRGVIVGPTPTPVTPPFAPTPGAGPQVIFTSPSEGWVCGDPLLHTADGGAHWQAQPLHQLAAGRYTCGAVPTDAWIAVQAPGGEVTVLPAQGGAHVAVSIGLPKLPPGATVAQVTFVDPENGWILVRPAEPTVGRGLLYRTTRGGVGFELVSSDAPIGHIQFVDARAGWGTDGDSIVRTADGGATWNAVVSPRDRATFGQWSFFDGLSVRGSTIVVQGVDVTVRRGTRRAFFLASADSGATWKRVDGPPARAAVVDAFETIDASQWRLLFGGQLWSTVDAGQTWTAVALPANTVSVSFPSIESSWALDTNGALFRWSDAGPRWERVDTSPEPPWTSGLPSVPNGCPAQTPTAPAIYGGGVPRPSPRDQAVAAARVFVRQVRGWTGEEVLAAYPVTQAGGQYGELFAYNVPKFCGAEVARLTWGVELGNPSVTQDSSRSTALVVAPFGGEWKVWGFYR